MTFTANFGFLTASSAEPKNSDLFPFRIAVLGDFSGRANRGSLDVSAELSSRKPLKIDVDNLDEVINRLDIQLELEIAGGTVELAIESIDDFHPDELYPRLGMFDKLAGLRRMLENTATFAKAAKAVDSWKKYASSEASGGKPRSRGSAIPSGKLSDFAGLVNRPATPRRGATAVNELVRKIIAPHVVAAPDPRQPELVAAVDEALSGAMRSVLHHPDFQALESLWRSVDFLCRRLEAGSKLHIVLFDISAEEFAADLSSTGALEETGIYQLLVEQPVADAHQGSFSVIAANYTFEQTPPHAELLGRMAKIAAATQAPFLAAIGTDCLKPQDPDEVHPLIRQSWETLRQIPEAAYLGLTVPRFMLRQPYGKRSDPIDSFEFEEFTDRGGVRAMLWGNSAMLAALLLAQTCSEQGLKHMKLGSLMSVDDLPYYYYTDGDGDQIALPCTERLINVRTAANVTPQGFMPVLSIQGQPVVRLGSFGALGGSMLAGPWSPVEVPGDGSAAATPADTSHTAEDADSESGDEADSASEDATDDDLDALLASLDSDDADTNDEDMDEDLAALLADL